MIVKGKILIIDDEIKVINALKRIFEKDKYEIISVTNPEEAIGMFRDDLDIIICDHNMPNMSGIEVLQHAKKMIPYTIRILITGYFDLEIAISAINEGSIYYFFSKPWKNKEVISVIEKAMEYKYEQEKKTSLYEALNDNKEHLLELTRGLKTYNTKSKRKFPVREDENIILIDSREILYLSAMEGNVFVITEIGEYKSSESLNWWAENLEENNFFRTHRSYIVNLDKIDKISPWFNGAYNINFKNLKDEIPVSRTAMKDLKILLGF